ncbi:restriction endonuclease subunit S [Mailhella sp.]
MARPRKNAPKPNTQELSLVPVEEQPYPLPEGWKWVRLISGFAECLDKFRKPINSTERANREGPIPYYGATGQVGWIDDYLTDEHLVLVGEDGAPFLDVIKNKAYIIEGKAWVNNHAHILRSFWDKTGNVYLMHYLNSFNYTGYVNGTTRLKLTQASLNTIPIPLPPLDEQERIVTRIESLFAKLDEAKEKAETVLDSYETRKAAILHKAFTGELTAKWRGERGIEKESWKSCILLSVLKEKPRNGYSPKPVEYETNVKSMTLSATTSGFFRPEFFKYIDEEIPEDSHLWLKYGDILIQRANSLEKVGTSAIYTGGNHEFIYPDLIMKLQVKEGYDTSFIANLLKTQEVLSYFRANATGTAGNMPKINQQTVSNTPITVPTLPEQQEITRILDSLLEKEQQSKEVAETVLEQIDLMKKAILAKAFRGELG